MITHKMLEDVEYLKAPANFKDLGRTRDLWWPFWAWRIVAPKENKESDLLMELMLRLINAGVKDRSRLAKLSCLEEEFVAHLLVLLTEHGYIANWQVTDDGKFYLEKGYQRDNDFQSFYLLQDPETKKIIPRVLKKLPFIENVFFDGGYPFYIKNRKTGRQIKPFLVREFSESTSQPSSDSIYEAIRKHRIDNNKVKQAEFEYEDVGLMPDQVSLLDEMPISVYMNLKLFTGLGGERAWYLSDPTGLLPSLRDLNEVADKRLKSDKGLLKLVESLIGDSLTENERSYLEHQKQLDEHAKIQLMSEYSWATKNASVEKYVLRMLKDKIQIESNKSSRPEALNESFENYLSNLQKICEAIMKILISPNKERFEWEVLEYPETYQKSKVRTRELGRQQKKALFIQSGIEDDDIAWNLSGVKMFDIKIAMQTGEKSLRQLVAAFVLLHSGAVHDLNTALPNWSGRMLALARARNTKSAHANIEEHDASEIQVYDSFVESLLKYVEGIFTNDQK